MRWPFATKGEKAQPVITANVANASWLTSNVRPRIPTQDENSPHCCIHHNHWRFGGVSSICTGPCPRDGLRWSARPKTHCAPLSSIRSGSNWSFLVRRGVFEDTDQKMRACSFRWVHFLLVDLARQPGPRGRLIASSGLLDLFLHLLKAGCRRNIWKRPRAEQIATDNSGLRPSCLSSNVGQK